MTVIVLEGPDGAGKTTLADQIRAAAAKRYFLLIRHSCRPYTGKDATNFQNLLYQARGSGLTVIADRHAYISEPIYGPLLRNENLVDFLTPEERLHQLEMSVDTIVYCRPPAFVIREGLKAAPQLPGVNDQLTVLIQEYDNYFGDLEESNTRINILRYNWTSTESFANLMKELF